MLLLAEVLLRVVLVQLAERVLLEQLVVLEQPAVAQHLKENLLRGYRRG